MFDVQQRVVPEQLVLTEPANSSGDGEGRSPQQCVGSPRIGRRMSD